MRCLLQFSQDFHWIQFRHAELDALLKMYGIDPSTAYSDAIHDKEQAFLFIDLPDKEIIKSICRRSVLIRNVYELWGHSNSISGLVADLKTLPRAFLEPHVRPTVSWSVQVDPFCRSYTMQLKEKCRLNFNFLPFEGKVELSNPDVELWVILDYTGKADVETVEDPQVPCYFGRLLAKGGMKEELKKYDLKKRLYLGPTSLDPALALIMSNMAHIHRVNVVFDPFVGTASILVAMSHFGAVCFGADIDTRVLRGEMYAGAADKKVDDTKRDIFENFKEYGLVKPELVRMDNHLFDRHAVVCTDKADVNGNVVEGGVFDAIVTDPPYGIRAGAKKSGKRKQVDYTVPPEKRFDHIPSTQHYPVEEVMLDLLHTAAKGLVNGGHLAYLIPTMLDFTAHDLPQHPCLELVTLCEQQLSTRHSRHAVVMRKFRPYTPELVQEFKDYKTRVLARQDEGFGSLMSKLEAALAADAYDNEKVVKKCSVKSVKRRESKLQRAKLREDGVFYSHATNVTDGTTIDASATNMNMDTTSSESGHDRSTNNDSNR